MCRGAGHSYYPVLPARSMKVARHSTEGRGRIGSGGWNCTSDLLGMSQASYRLLHPAKRPYVKTVRSVKISSPGLSPARLCAWCPTRHTTWLTIESRQVSPSKGKGVDTFVTRDRRPLQPGLSEPDSVGAS